MIVLLQLINYFKNLSNIDGLKYWMDTIEDLEECHALAEYLDDHYGIELTKNQIEILFRVIKNKSYKSAFKMVG